MSKILVVFCVVSFLFSCNSQDGNDSVFNKIQAKKVLDLSVELYKHNIVSIPDSLLPRNVESDGKIRYVKSWDWTSGFYPGTLWYLFEYSGDEDLKSQAEQYTDLLENEKWDTGTHDLGFMLYCSYGNGFRITKNTNYAEVLKVGAKSLASRYNEKIGCIKSWDWAKQWEFPVIVDNMMNLEYLFWATKVTMDSTYYEMAITHADMTIKNHFRNDFSSYHVVNYDTISTHVKSKETLQGYDNESTWARGQAWGLYGFTMMYRFTKETRFLDQANKIANFVLTDPRVPTDLVPYWDFDDPEIPNSPRDASAAAITASALLELQSYVEDGKVASFYVNSSAMILKTLSNEEFGAFAQKNNHFLLNHSTGNLPAGGEIDTPIIYADYYFVEALMRFVDLERK